MGKWKNTNDVGTDFRTVSNTSLQALHRLFVFKYQLNNILPIQG